jgi:hypothetical protein
MTSAKIHTLTSTPMGILIVFRDRLWEFRVIANGSVYGRNKAYYTPEAALGAGREWVGGGWNEL